MRHPREIEPHYVPTWIARLAWVLVLCVCLRLGLLSCWCLDDRRKEHFQYFPMLVQSGLEAHWMSSKDWASCVVNNCKTDASEQQASVFFVHSSPFHRVEMTTDSIEALGVTSIEAGNLMLDGWDTKYKNYWLLEFLLITTKARWTRATNGRAGEFDESWWLSVDIDVCNATYELLRITKSTSIKFGMEIGIKFSIAKGCN